MHPQDWSARILHDLNEIPANEGCRLVHYVDARKGWGDIHNVTVFTGITQHDAGSRLEKAIHMIVATSRTGGATLFGSAGWSLAETPSRPAGESAYQETPALAQHLRPPRPSANRSLRVKWARFSPVCSSGAEPRSLRPIPPTVYGRPPALP